VKIALDVSFHY